MTFSRKSITTVVTDALLQFLMLLTMAVISYSKNPSLCDALYPASEVSEFKLIAVKVYELYLDIIVDKR